MKVVRQLAVGVAMGALLSAPLPSGRAAAHAELIELEPAAGSTLEEPPRAVVAVFDEELGVERSWIELIDSSEQVVARGTLDLEDLERRTLVVAVPPDLPDGVYVVRWETGSVADDHIVPGEARFAVGEAASAPADGTEFGREQRDTTRAWLLWLAVAVAAAGAAVMVAVQGRRRRRQPVDAPVNARSG